jgi:penicillin-binding protein 2
MVNLPMALTASSDYYFYNIGYLFSVQPSKYGQTPIQDVAAAYGIGQQQGIDLPGVAVGRTDSKATRLRLHALAPKAYPNTTWYVGDDIEMAFGQGSTAVTPLEMTTAYATFLNGGTRYAPQVAAGIVSPGGKLLQRFEPKVMGHVNLNPSITQPILDGLFGVVQNSSGTAFPTFQQYAHFDYSRFSVGGKTGTASNAPGLEPNSWFVGFGPGSAPNYVVLCVIDQGGYGANAAAPVVAQTFNYLATNPVGPVRFPTAVNPPSATAPATQPPAGTPPPAPPTTTTVPGG